MNYEFDLSGGNIFREQNGDINVSWILFSL